MTTIVVIMTAKYILYHHSSGFSIGGSSGLVVCIVTSVERVK